MLALSFHAVFEGLAVGLEESNSDVWTMFGAIATHKFIITFCVRLYLLLTFIDLRMLSNVVENILLSMELLQAGVSRLSFALFLITFSLIR